MDWSPTRQQGRNEPLAGASGSKASAPLSQAEKTVAVRHGLGIIIGTTVLRSPIRGASTEPFTGGGTVMARLQRAVAVCVFVGSLTVLTLLVPGRAAPQPPLP